MKTQDKIKNEIIEILEVYVLKSDRQAQRMINQIADQLLQLLHKKEKANLERIGEEILTGKLELLEKIKYYTLEKKKIANKGSQYDYFDAGYNEVIQDLNKKLEEIKGDLIKPSKKPKK